MTPYILAMCVSILFFFSIGTFFFSTGAWQGVLFGIGLYLLGGECVYILIFNP